jgi:DNA polymerase delta subunit 1
MHLGKEAASLVSRQFAAPIALEFEKAYCPYFLFAKKRYAGLLFASDPQIPDRLDKKGVESVRRDSCEFVHDVYEGALSLLCRSKNEPALVAEAAALVQREAHALLSGRVDIHRLLLSKQVPSNSPSPLRHPWVQSQCGAPRLMQCLTTRLVAYSAPKTTR